MVFRVLKIVIIIHCIIVILLLSSLLIISRKEPILANCDDIQTDEAIAILNSQYNKKIKYNRTRKDYRNIIEADFNCRFYIYREVDLPEGNDGQCSLILRTITMDSNIDNFYYCSAFAHEVIHLTSYIAQENYVTYQTFKYLYEHPDPELHNFGIRVGLHCLLGGYPPEYSCSGEIIGYLQSI